MIAKNTTLFGLTILLFLLVAAGCGRDDLMSPAEATTDPVVFDDNFGAGVDYEAFEYSKLDAVQLNFTEVYEGSASLIVTVPGPGATDGTYAGGAFTTNEPRDLTQYNALTFYAKSSMNSTINECGVGNNNTGASLYTSTRRAVALTTDWERVVIPIPGASKLTFEDGLFFISEGYENDMEYDFWLDEIRFETLDSITNPRPVMDTRSEMTFVGGFLEITGTATTFDVDGEDVLMEHMPACFDYTSSDDAVAVVTDGTIRAVGGGEATITAHLDTVDVEGEFIVEVMDGPDGPADAPTVPEEDVISLFSDVYDDVTVDTWHAPWTGSTGEVTDFQVDGDNVKLYTDLNFAGIEFVSELIDAETPGMTHLHLDVWAPSGGLFKVKLVDFGANGVYDGGGDDSEYELMFNGGTVPPFYSGVWSPLEIPLSDFVGLTSTEHLAQMVISSSDVRTVMVDNVYFHK